MSVNDLGECLTEIALRVHIVEPGGLHDGVHGCGPVAAAVGAGKEVVLASKGDAAHGVLGNIVVDLEPGIGDKA